MYGCARRMKPEPVQRLLLGVDTGGTYTDSVIVDEVTGSVISKAKATTTHHDLSIGIAESIVKALLLGAVRPESIELVSMSTTLATNALVEGKGRSVCAVVIGFDQAVVERAGLAEALGSDPVIFLRGGHDPYGTAVTELDIESLRQGLAGIADTVQAYAVTAEFSVRNPEHELAAQHLIREVTGRPVTCSHELAAALNGPKRAVTAILNARLIAIIDQLLTSTLETMAAEGITAPLMVVRGDGSLVSAGFVRDRPIETILSGPAASVVGAAHLTGSGTAIVADIGGTTTDVGILRDGRPSIDARGARVGGHHTMVAAIAMYTTGLGGDSYVRFDDRSLTPMLLLGPRRVVPVSLLATTHAQLVHDILDRQLRASMPNDSDGLMIIRHQGPQSGRSVQPSPLSQAERRLVDSIDQPVTEYSTIASSPSIRRTLDRLLERGVLQLCGFTPTDASHVLGIQATFDADAALKAATLQARRRDARGRVVAASAMALCRQTIDVLTKRSAEAVMAAAFIDDGLPPDVVSSAVVQAALDRQFRMVRLHASVSAPLVALGASAATYYPAVAEMLGTEIVLSEHSDVANAIGAVVGRVRIIRQCVISGPQVGLFVVHAGTDQHVCTTLDAAKDVAKLHLCNILDSDMIAAGAAHYETTWSWSEQTVDAGGHGLFVEGCLRCEGAGRPQLAI